MHAGDPLLSPAWCKGSDPWCDESLCKKFCEFAPTEADHHELVARLVCSRLLAPVSGASAAVLRLMVQPDDVRHITRNVPELAVLFPPESRAALTARWTVHDPYFGS